MTIENGKKVEPPKGPRVEFKSLTNGQLKEHNDIKKEHFAAGWVFVAFDFEDRDEREKALEKANEASGTTIGNGVMERLSEEQQVLFCREFFGDENISQAEVKPIRNNGEMGWGGIGHNHYLILAK